VSAASMMPRVHLPRFRLTCLAWRMRRLGFPRKTRLDCYFRGRARVGLIYALSVVICIYWLPRFGFASEVLEQKFDGIVVPRLWVQVTPQINGVISRILFAPGQRVSKGDPLFEMDPGDFAINVRIAQAELDESRARLRIAEDAAGRQRLLLTEKSTAQQTAVQSQIDVEIARAINARNEAALAKAQLVCREPTSWQPSRELSDVHV